jgi:signal-transduction protein with cAMP-binding, CBS, and nucleotidyltransferase domain
MTRSVATVGPAHTLRQAAATMAIHSAGAAVVLDPDAAGPEIVTEHDILVSLARGQGPDQERAVDHFSSDIVYASPSRSLELAAVVMVDRGRRHLVVCEGGDLVGVLSMRDVVRCWTQEGANCALPRLPAEVASTGPFARSKPGTQTSSPSSAEIDAAKVDEGHEVLNSVLGF